MTEAYEFLQNPVYALLYKSGISTYKREAIEMT